MTVAEPDTATVWYTRCPLPTAAGVAITRGLLDLAFAPSGVAVRSLREAPARADRHAHFTHAHPALFRQGGNVPPIWARSGGADTRVIGLSWIDTFQGILALPGRGIREPADLAGARLALPCHVNDPIDFWRAMTLHGLDAALALGGLTLGDAQLVDLDVDEHFITGADVQAAGMLFTARESARLWSTELRALIRGEVDAMYVYGPVGLQTAALVDADVVVDLGAQPDRRAAVNGGQPAVLTVSGALLDERPELVDRYVAALLDAADWAASEPDEAVRIFAYEAGAGEDWARDAHPPALAARLRPALDDDLVEALAAQVAFLHAHGFISTPVDVRTWIDPGPLARTT